MRRTPASLYCCLQAARANAHAVRGRITADMWENINATWLEMRGIAAEGLGATASAASASGSRSARTCSVAPPSAPSCAARPIASSAWAPFIERADNTLRLLDARYEMLGEAADEVSDTRRAAITEWSALLRALSSFESFTEIYRGSPRTRKIAELLLLRSEVPRSLRACMEELNLMLAGLPGETAARPQRLAAELDARLRYTSIDEVLDEGLHTWLTDFILLVRQLGSAIHTSYLEVV